MAKSTFKTTSISSAKTVSDLVKAGVRVSNPKKGKGTLEFCTSISDCNKVCKILNTYERVYEVKTSKGIKSLFARFGILIALVVSIIGVVVLSNFVFSISVSGVERIESCQIIDYLDAKGIKKGCAKSSIDCDTIERDLMQKFDFSVVDCKIVGGVLVLSVKEELPPPDYADLVEKTPIVACEDAVITRIVTISGTTLVKRGVSVKKGDILISPSKTIGDITLPTNAIGEIHGKVWRKREVFIPDTVITKERTGVTSEIKYLSFGKLELPNLSPYPYYESEIRRTQTVVLPFFLNTITFYECRLVESKNPLLSDYSSVIESMLGDLKLDLVEQKGEYIDHWHYEQKVDGGIIVTVVCEVEMNIGTYSNK